jgi:hypothetical protein
MAEGGAELFEGGATDSGQNAGAARGAKIVGARLPSSKGMRYSGPSDQMAGSPGPREAVRPALLTGPRGIGPRR